MTARYYGSTTINKSTDFYSKILWRTYCVLVSQGLFSPVSALLDIVINMSSERKKELKKEKFLHKYKYSHI